MDPTFEVSAARLPTQGRPKAPLLAGWYWTAWQDTIDYRWDGDGTLSPAEKFERLTGRENVAWATSAADGVLSYSGNDAVSCSSDADCAGSSERMLCGKRRGAAAGTCIAWWHGICHGFSAFAISEPRAKGPVARDGVLFYPADLDALMSLLYADAIDFTLLGSRCDNAFPQRDSTGRIVDTTCRNVNPAAFHLALTNLVGVRGASFIVDESPRVEVWNRPVVSYSVKNATGKGLREVSRAEALALLDVNTSYVPIATAVNVAAGRSEGGTYAAPVDGSYVLRATGPDDFTLHATTSGTEVCVSQTYGLTQQCLLPLKAGQIVTWSAEAPGDAAARDIRVGVASELAGNIPYFYDENATRFFYVAVDVVLLGNVEPSRAAPSTSSPLLNAHYREYQYILEANDGGRILGGEWAGGSKENHPAFVWAPTSTPRSAAMGKIPYAEVKSLNDEAAGLRKNYVSHLVNPRILSVHPAVRPPIVEPPANAGTP